MANIMQVVHVIVIDKSSMENCVPEVYYCVHTCSNIAATNIISKGRFCTQKKLMLFLSEVNSY